MTAFIETLAPYAMKHGKAFNILPSLILAQGIHETGSGTSELAQKANNLFGIKKGMDWDGEVYSVVTHEYRKNAETGEDEKYYITAEFRKYDSYEGAVIDLCEKYNTMSRYAAVPGNFVFDNVAQAVKDAGYATDPTYPDKLRRVYASYDLGRFDTDFVTEIIEDIVEDLEDLIEIIEEDKSMAFKVVIDAGHGRNTPGKRTPAGEREWTFNDVVARAVIAELNKYANVEILRVDDPTGNSDVPLNTRTARANSWGGSVYVSIHHNANTGVWGTWTGVETFVYTATTATDGSMKLAQAVHPRLVKAMGLKDRGIKKANFAVIRQSKMPAILTEGGYMDSTIDIVKMRNQDVLRGAGVAIAQGIAAYAGLKLKAGAPATPAPTPAKPTPVSNPNLYRVRKTWADADSQKGAFADLDGAITLAKANSGYKVFDAKGSQVYPDVIVATPTPSDNLFRVRKLWSDAASQIGAYSTLEGAKEIADKNITFNVYDAKGNVVYDPRKARDEAAAKAKVDADAKAKAEADAKAKAEEAARLAKEKAEQEAKTAAIEEQRKIDEAEFAKAIELGITDGSNPNDPATRRQVAIMIVRALKLK